MMAGTSAARAAKVLKPAVLAQPVAEIVHAKLPVADLGRRGAVIEDGQGQGVGRQRQPKGCKGLPDRCVVEVAEVDVAESRLSGQPRRLGLAHDLHAHLGAHQRSDRR